MGMGHRSGDGEKRAAEGTAGMRPPQNTYLKSRHDRTQQQRRLKVSVKKEFGSETLQDAVYTANELAMEVLVPTFSSSSGTVQPTKRKIEQGCAIDAVVDGFMVLSRPGMMRVVDQSHRRLFHFQEWKGINSLRLHCSGPKILISHFVVAAMSLGVSFHAQRVIGK